MDDALEPNERLKAERDAYKLACERAGVCMSCVIQAPETYGCPDCMNTGWQQGDPYERIKQLETEKGPAIEKAFVAGSQWQRNRRTENG